MKLIIAVLVKMVVCFFIFFLWSCGDSSQPVTAPSYDISLPASIGTVLLKHSTHSAQTCEACHMCGVGDGKISFMSKDWAHSTCKGCHAIYNPGPTSCKGCHIKTPAAKTVSITQTGAAEFAVIGTDMDGTAGIMMEIGYDAAAFESPIVTSGSLIAGALTSYNTTRPGVIRIAIISSQPFTGSVQIVSISFLSVKARNAGLSLKIIEAVTVMGEPVSVSAQITSQATGSTSVPANTPDVTATTVPTPATSSLPVCQ